MRQEQVRRLMDEELKGEDGNYSCLEVLRSAAGFYIGRNFIANDGNTEPGSRESDYFPNCQEAKEALTEGFEWRNVTENCRLYDTHEQLTESSS